MAISCRAKHGSAPSAASPQMHPRTTLAAGSAPPQPAPASRVNDPKRMRQRRVPAIHLGRSARHASRQHSRLRKPGTLLHSCHRAAPQASMHLSEVAGAAAKVNYLCALQHAKEFSSSQETCRRVPDASCFAAHVLGCHAMFHCPSCKCACLVWQPKVAQQVAQHPVSVLDRAVEEGCAVEAEPKAARRGKLISMVRWNMRMRLSGVEEMHGWLNATTCPTNEARCPIHFSISPMNEYFTHQPHSCRPPHCSAGPAGRHRHPPPLPPQGARQRRRQGRPLPPVQRRHRLPQLLRSTCASDCQAGWGVGGTAAEAPERGGAKGGAWRRFCTRLQIACSR